VSPAFSAIAADILLGVLLAICLVSDILWKRIPDWATLPAMALGLALNTIAVGWPGLKASGIGLAFGFGALFVLFVFGSMGGGDVKLMGAIGALKGFPFILAALAFSILVGGFIGIAVLIWRKRLLRTLKSIFLFLVTRLLPVRRRHNLDEQAMQRVPFGIAIVIGTAWALVANAPWNPLRLVAP
jgi:prepilin peptidase CpaA